MSHNFYKLLKIRSTATCLQEIVDHINSGLNKKQPVERTVAVCIDLSRAFDTVDHSILLKDIQQLQLNDHIKRFLKAYIRGRFTYVEFRGAKSKHRKMTQAGFGIRAIKADLGSRLLDPLFFTAPDSALDLGSVIVNLLLPRYFKSYYIDKAYFY